MALEKANIINLDTNESLAVMFNPQEYAIEKQTGWEGAAVHGLDAPELQFTSGQAQTLRLELVFDTFESDTDVRQYTQKLQDFTLVNADLHRPPVVMFSWGKTQFQSVLVHLKLRFTLFNQQGIPLRAFAQIELREFSPAKQQHQKKPRNSPDHTKKRVVVEGETLAQISQQEYGTPHSWRLIAKHNSIADPLDLKAGLVLLVPPIHIELFKTEANPS